MSARRGVLVVEDDALLRQSLVLHLKARYSAISAASCAEARAAFERHSPDLVVLDLNLPDGDGLSLVEAFRRDGAAEVVVMTAFPKVQSAVRALKAGALDYLNKPFELDEFDLVVERAIEHRGLRDEVDGLRRQNPKVGGLDRILGDAPAIVSLREEILQVARTPDTTVLVRGETGTGKELVAEAVHAESMRRKNAFVRVNCSSIPASMVESELFGHERGAFTDARAARQGLVELAEGGTLFLDEIGDLPLDLQPKLLTVLESRCFRRIGGNREIATDARFVAATNRDLEAMVKEGRFRADLLFRLKVFEVFVPALGERRSDLAVLARHFLAGFAQRLGRPVPALSASAAAALARYSWPGNVRELRNVLERAVILARGDTIERIDLPDEGAVSAPSACLDFCPCNPEGAGSFPPLSEVEARYLGCVYRLVGGNKTRAAEILGISRVTLREKLRQSGVGGDEP